MKLVIFGLTLSSSWGNGHATLLRGLIRALTRRNHDVVFFERDVPYYAAHRDLPEMAGADLILYPQWSGIRSRALTEARQADVAIVTSYCPDAKAAAALIGAEAPRALSVFYDLDTPVTLARLEAGESVEYVPEEGLRQFDLVLSYTGGAALEALRSRLGARRVAALYGHVDPQAHRRAPPDERFSADLSYLGTYACDRQQTLEALFVEPARRRPARRFVLGGSGYPPDFPWAGNIWFVQHVAPPEHPPFYSSSRLTLNVTRRDMARMGFCPSGRLFEAAACATPVLSDTWEGIDRFFTPGKEILLAGSAEEATAALDLPAEELARIGRAARERALDEHTSDCRAVQMLSLLDGASAGAAV
ncbi:MAG TPA: glycosyltransferase [Steroidobacteraceae bacterium]|nr:glycosyltransferase [Steroidobacteraceae bacterium]